LLGGNIPGRFEHDAMYFVVDGDLNGDGVVDGADQALLWSWIRNSNNVPVTNATNVIINGAY